MIATRGPSVVLVLSAVTFEPSASRRPSSSAFTSSDRRAASFCCPSFAVCGR